MKLQGKITCRFLSRITNHCNLLTDEAQAKVTRVVFDSAWLLSCAPLLVSTTDYGHPRVVCCRSFVTCACAGVAREAQDGHGLLH